MVFLLAVAINASIVAAACGDDGGDFLSDPVSEVGPGISTGESLSTDLNR